MIGINAIPFYNLVQNQQIIFIEINSLFEIIHNLGHELSEPQENKKDFLKIKKESKEKIKIKVEKINILINKFNQNLKTFKDSYNFNQIPLIKKKVIQIIEIFEYKKEKELIKVEGSFIKYLKKRKEKIEKEGCEIKKEIEHQRLKTYFSVQKTSLALQEINEKINEKNRKFLKYKKLSSSDYIIYWIEIVNLFGLGYEELSVFLSGRLLEKICTDLLMILVQNKKILNTKESILEMKFENKIGLLKNQKIISDKNYFKIQSIKIDRNDVAHPTELDKMIKLKKEAETQIKTAFDVIEEIMPTKKMYD